VHQAQVSGMIHFACAEKFTDPKRFDHLASRPLERGGERMCGGEQTWRFVTAALGATNLLRMLK